MANVGYHVSFVYYTQGDHGQRMTAQIDCEADENLSTVKVAKAAWKLLTRNWEKPQEWLTANVTRI